jgi:glucosamine--fructose-6-phosphate aminotransferase (isomerizing)
MISNIREVKSRGAELIIISRDSIEFPDDLADYVLRTADVGEFLQPIVTATEIQLLAYYLSLHLGLDVDRPRNLAKSVTVE